jgi:short-chain fatty acids transporter
MKAVAECVPATGGVMIQFPFYAVIFGMIVGTGISDWLAGLFAALTAHNTFPLLVAIYSGCLGSLFRPGAANG